MRVVFAAAEFHPIATVGGLAAAAAGLVGELRRQGVDVDLVLPDYGDVDLLGQTELTLDVPDWVSPAVVRSGEHPQAGRLHLISAPGVERPHPYLREDGTGWDDNDARFLRFSRALAAFWRHLDADVLHLNDWHTAAAMAELDPSTPTVLSIHNLAHQGVTAGGWLQLIGPRSRAFEWYGQCNPFMGGLALADRIIAVSPTYASEIQQPEHGCGLDQLLVDRHDALHGILNGIDVDVWDPTTDPHLPVNYNADDLVRGKAAAKQLVRRRFGFDHHDRPARPLVVMVTRLTEQKGTDLVTPLGAYLDRLGIELAVLGSGESDYANGLHRIAESSPSVAFIEGYDEALSHLLFAAGDALLMPSRFEPCGLAQMQALRYGTLPIATPVGGLRDTVFDLDDNTELFGDNTESFGDNTESFGNGWLADEAEPIAILDALHRAVRAWNLEPDGRALVPVRQQAMAIDWSWEQPAHQHHQLYSQLASH